MIRYAHSKSDSYEWQHQDTWLNLYSQGFRDQWQAWYLGRFSSCYHRQTIRTSISMCLRSDSCCSSIRQDWQGRHSSGTQYFNSNLHWSKSLCRLHTWLLGGALNSWKGRSRIWEKEEVKWSFLGVLQTGTSCWRDWQFSTVVTWYRLSKYEANHYTIWELHCQTKIAGTLHPTRFFFFFLLLARLLVLSILFIAVNSPNLEHQHWEGKKTVKCLNSFD